jgi:hypothetical protein
MLRVLIADDHEFIRQGIKLILSEEYPLAHFEEAETHIPSSIKLLTVIGISFSLIFQCLAAVAFMLWKNFQKTR